MLRKSKDVEGLRLGARDGEIGRVKDFYFDDQSWTVRYLVADTGTWLSGRLVLISPHAVQSIHPAPDKAVEVDLTKRQIEESPSILADMPVSRQFEAEYCQHYNWPFYWEGPWVWGPAPFPMAYRPESVPPAPASRPTDAGDRHLRSANETSHYAIQALDHKLGHVEEFLIDEQDWAVRYLVVDTRNWWPGKRVLVPPQWISWVSWNESRVYVDLDRETIRHAPEYDPSVPVTRDYEAMLFDHYGREPYWATPAKAA